MRLLDSQEDLELAVIKALNGANLTVDEIDELRDLTVRILMADHGCDYLMADKVLRHVSSEDLRMNAQNLESPIEDYEDEGTSLTRLTPISEQRKKTRASLHSLLRRLVNDELAR